GELGLQQIDPRLRQLARERRIARRSLRPLEQRIEPPEREREHAREPEPGEKASADERQEARGEHHREEPRAEPAPGAAILHRARAYTKKRWLRNDRDRRRAGARPRGHVRLPQGKFILRSSAA